MKSEIRLYILETNDAREQPPPYLRALLQGLFNYRADTM